MEVDSIDVKFNETFLPCRERKGKMASGAMEPDLQIVPSSEQTELTENPLGRFNDEIEIIATKQGQNNAEIEVRDSAVNPNKQQYGRGQRHPIQRQFYNQALAQVPK
jgi:hypothetical protein